MLFFTHPEQSSNCPPSPHTLCPLRAYLYSWLKSGLLLASYDAEHLLHGAVGFLLDVYVEHILGADEGR